VRSPGPPWLGLARFGRRHRVSEVERRCQGVTDTDEGRSQRPLEAICTETLHVGSDLYALESCDRSRTGLIEVEPIHRNWERL
jgi:hypothetical protein